MATIEKVSNDPLLQAAEAVVTTVRHVEVVRNLAVELTRVTGAVYVCPCGCQRGSWPVGDGQAEYGIISSDSPVINDHSDDVDITPGDPH